MPQNTEGEVRQMRCAGKSRGVRCGKLLAEQRGKQITLHCPRCEAYNTFELADTSGPQSPKEQGH